MFLTTAYVVDSVSIQPGKKWYILYMHTYKYILSSCALHFTTKLCRGVSQLFSITWRFFYSEKGIYMHHVMQQQQRHYYACSFSVCEQVSSKKKHIKFSSVVMVCWCYHAMITNTITTTANTTGCSSISRAAVAVVVLVVVGRREYEGKWPNANSTWNEWTKRVFLGKEPTTVYKLLEAAYLYTFLGYTE